MIYNQSGVYIFVPELPSLEEPDGYLHTSVQGRVVQFTIGVRVDGLVALKVSTTSGSTLLNHTVSARAGDVLRVNVTVPTSEHAVIYECSIGGKPLPVGAVRIPEVTQLPENTPPVLAFLSSMLMMAVPLSFILTSDVRKAGVSLFSALPFIYVLMNYLSPMLAGVVTTAVAVILIISIIYFVVGRSSG
ncbi:MAG: hypothetical protein QXO22_04280 [Thermosphaera sp.]